MDTATMSDVIKRYETRMRELWDEGYNTSDALQAAVMTEVQDEFSPGDEVLALLIRWSEAHFAHVANGLKNRDRTKKENKRRGADSSGKGGGETKSRKRKDHEDSILSKLLPGANGELKALGDFSQLDLQARAALHREEADRNMDESHRWRNAARAQTAHARRFDKLRDLMIKEGVKRVKRLDNAEEVVAKLDLI